MCLPAFFKKNKLGKVTLIRIPEFLRFFATPLRS
jgi:hypothetical protein